MELCVPPPRPPLPNKVLQPWVDGWRYHRLPGIPRGCAAGTADEQPVAEGASKPRSGTPWPRAIGMVRASQDVEGSRINPTLQDTEQVTNRKTHDTGDGCCAAASVIKAGGKATDPVRGDKDVLCGGRRKSHESVVFNKASPQKGDAVEMRLGKRPPPERLNGEAKEDNEGRARGALDGNGGTFLLHSRSGSCFSPKPQASDGAGIDPAHPRTGTNRQPESPERPRQEAVLDQTTARSTAMMTAKPAASELPTPDAARCSIGDGQSEQKATAVDPHPEIEPAYTSPKLLTADSFQAVSTTLSPSLSHTPVKGLDPSNSNMTNFADHIGRLGCEPHSCERHGLAACTLRRTCALGSLGSSEADGEGTAGPPSAGTAPIIGGTLTPVSVGTMSGNVSRTAGRRSTSRLADAVQPSPENRIGDDQTYFTHNADNIQNKQKLKTAFLQTTAGKGAAAGVEPGDPCDRHLLLDCILCKMLTPTAYGGGVSPTVLGRSTSLPALGATSQRGGGMKDESATAAAATIAKGTRDRRSTTPGLSVNRCERHDLLGCFLCGLGAANSTTTGGELLKQYFRANEMATFSSSQRLVLPPPVLHDVRPGTGGTPPSRGFVGQNSKTSTAATLGFELAPWEECFPAVGKYSFCSSDQPSSHSDGMKTRISTSKSTKNGLTVAGRINQVREIPDGTNRAGDQGECIAGTRARETPVGGALTP